MNAREQQIQEEIQKLSGGPMPDAGELAMTLGRICELVSDAHPETAKAAAELLNQVQEGGGNRLDERLRSGLCQLQEVMGREMDTPGESPSHPEDLSEDPELIGDFVIEAREHVAAIEANLLDLEKDPELRESVNSVFRSFHTIKGLTGFLGLDPIHQVAHETETILDLARDKRISISPHLIDTALKAADYIRVALDALSSKPPGEAMKTLPPNHSLLQEIASAAQGPRRGDLSVPASGGSEISEPDVRESDRDRTPQGEEPREAGNTTSGKKSDTSVVRVDTAKLEYLVEMVGELVIAQSLINFGPDENAGRTGMARNLAHLSRVTGEIQRTALSMRMVPISRLYDKMTRLVRDLARKSNKRIELRRIGDQVELDRNIVEEITDPFVHMIRNSVDHGIEEAESRIAAGKPETAVITLEAFHQAGHIILRLSDDGKGLNAGKIRDKAVERGLISADTKMDENSIYRLIFEPGFSTAERVTAISGRGVGMDVVRRQIEKLRGTIEIASRPGCGSSFTLKLPLTLAMVDGLIVESSAERYVLPIYSVREMFRILPEQLFTLENRAELVLLRGSLLPVIRLDRFFGKPVAGSGDIGIVMEGRTRPFCLVVDRMLGKQEVVIKTLGPWFQAVDGIAGGAILGDGRVGLILDVHGIDGGDSHEA